MNIQSHVFIERKARVVKGGKSYLSKQGTEYLPGISAETVGSESLWLGIVTLHPGQRTKAHVHEHHETAFYLMSGSEVELWTGAVLENCEKVTPGDYLFIPANLPHVAVNRGVETAIFIGSRNEPTAQESLVLYPDLDEKVP
jgi:uncharacterized RmlC-like cupin family protein